MSSNGILNEPKRAKCRMCRCSKKTEYLKKVGEVHHGFATGYVWECINIKKCDLAAMNKLKKLTLSPNSRARILQSIKDGRIKKYSIFI